MLQRQKQPGENEAGAVGVLWPILCGPLKGQAFKFTTQEYEGKATLHSGFAIQQQRGFEDLGMDPKRLKEYCHRASDAQCAGAIGGELGGGLGAYCFESMHREMCSGFDHQIGMAEGIGGIQVGSWASIPARTRPKQASAAIHQNELQQEEVSGAKVRTGHTCILHFKRPSNS